MQKTLSALSFVLIIVAFIPYILTILRGDTKPAKATWVIWATLDTIMIYGMYVENAVSGQIIGAMVGVWLVAILSLYYGSRGWNLFDKLCLVGAIFGIALWKTFESPILGIVVSNATLFVGALPTFRSAWNDPAKENRMAWAIFWSSCVCAVLAIPKLTLAHAAQPVTFFLIESIMMYLVFIHRPRR